MLLSLWLCLSLLSLFFLCFAFRLLIFFNLSIFLSLWFLISHFLYSPLIFTLCLSLVYSYLLFLFPSSSQHKLYLSCSTLAYLPILPFFRGSTLPPASSSLTTVSRHNQVTCCWFSRFIWWIEEEGEEKGKGRWKAGRGGRRVEVRRGREAGSKWRGTGVKGRRQGDTWKQTGTCRSLITKRFSTHYFFAVIFFLWGGKREGEHKQEAKYKTTTLIIYIKKCKSYFLRCFPHYSFSIVLFSPMGQVKMFRWVNTCKSQLKTKLFLGVIFHLLLFYFSPSYCERRSRRKRETVKCMLKSK